VFVFGAIVGMVLFSIAWIKAKFFASRSISVPKRRGRIIEHDE
jgi:hypothetical protein